MQTEDAGVETFYTFQNPDTLTVHVLESAPGQHTLGGDERERYCRAVCGYGRYLWRGELEARDGPIDKAEHEFLCGTCAMHAPAFRVYDTRENHA